MFSLSWLVLFPAIILAKDKCLNNFNACKNNSKITHITNQTLESDGTLTQILPNGTIFKFAQDNSTVIQYDSVSLETDGINNLVANTDGTYQLIFTNFSKISTFIQEDPEYMCCINTIHFECKDSSSCNLQCSGIQVCQGMDVEENKLSIGCNGRLSCQNLQAECKLEEECQLNCQGESTCNEISTIGKWNLDCKGNNVCNNIALDKSAGMVNCMGTHLCSNLKATCSSTDQSCFMNCMGINTCLGKMLQGEWQKAVAGGQINICQNCQNYPNNMDSYGGFIGSSIMEHNFGGGTMANNGNNMGPWGHLFGRKRR